MSRTKGAKNKFPSEAKENVVAVFIRLGGTAAMAEWARRHQTEFYRIYAKLVPVEQQVEHSGVVTLAEMIAGVIENEQNESDSADVSRDDLIN